MVVVGNRINEFTPSKVTLTADEFAGRYADLQSVLQTVSGVAVCDRGGFGHYADASIRGSSPGQVQVYLDGIPLNGATGNAVDLSKIAMPSLQTISIYKSVPPLQFFGDNAGGVISLATDSKQDAATGSLEAGSFGYAEGNAQIVKTDGRAINRLSVNYGQSANNYSYVDSLVTRSRTVETDDSQKTMDNNFFSTFSALYSTTLTINNRSKLTSQVAGAITDEGIFYLPMADSNDGYVRNTSLSLIESYADRIDPCLSLLVTASGKYDDNFFTRDRRFYLTAPVLHDITQPYASVESMLTWSIGCRAVVRGFVNGSYNGYEFDNLLAPASRKRPHYSRICGKVGAEATVYLPWNVSARAGGIYRYEIDSTNDSMTSYGTPVSGGGISKNGFPGGFAEVKYQAFNRLGLLGSIQYSSRSPGFSEKYSQGANITANPALLPETRLEYDLGFSFLEPFLALSGSVFWDATKNKIVFIAHSMMFTPTNVSDVNGWGIESDAILTPFPWVTAANSATYMENLVESNMYPSWNGRDEPLAPRFTDNLSIKFTYKNWYASHSARFVSQYYTGFDNLDTIRQGSPQLNATIGFSIGKHMDISYRIENYLNVQNYDFQRPQPGLVQYAVLKYSL